jgi:pimeloyl-ACP methyl ester carboxylesterase
LDVATLAGTFASVREHEQAGTLTRRLPDVPSSTPVLFVHGAKSPMPVRTTTMTAELIPHARVEILPDAGHFLWHEDPAGTHDAIARFVAGGAAVG